MSKGFLQRFHNRMQKVNKKGELEINKERFIKPALVLPQLHRKMSSNEDLSLSRNNSLNSLSSMPNHSHLPRFLTPARPVKYLKGIKISEYKLSKLLSQKNPPNIQEEPKLSKDNFCRYKTPQKLGRVKEVMFKYC